MTMPICSEQQPHSREILPADGELLVFFDATQLGLWVQSEAHRVGIGRMATGILRAFLERDDISLVLVCPCGMQAMVAAWLCEHIWAEKAVFPYDIPVPERKACVIVKAWIKSIVGAMLHALPGKWQAAVRRVLRVRPFSAYEAENPSLVALVLEHMQGHETAVWFSPFQPVPRCLAGIPHLFGHVVLHDIIPLRFPDEHPFSAYCSDIMRAHLQRADTIWANSHFTRDDFLDYYPEENPDQIRVAHHGGGEHFTPASPEDAATARRRCDIPEGVPFILCLTTLEPRKGLEHTIRAFIALLGSFPSPAPHLVIVGRKGWRYSPILKAARNCADEIHFTGFLPDATVRGLLTACDCFVFMSRYEGFGLPLVEAMACGAAVIASNATVIPEIVGDAALLLPPQDVDALAESMRLLCADSALRSKLRKAALQRAKHFTWEKCAETMVQSMRSSIGTQAEKCNETTR